MTSEKNGAEKYIKQRTKFDGGRGPKIKVAENGLKHILVFEFLKFFEIFESGNICE